MKLPGSTLVLTAIFNEAETNSGPAFSGDPYFFEKKASTWRKTASIHDHSL
jgi:hypothetical protein